LKRVKAEFGTSHIGAIAHPTSTVEELHLLAQLMRGVGSESIDHRLRHADFANAAPAGSARWLDRSIASLTTLDRALVIGSSLRKDHPLMAQRIRQAAKRGAVVMSLHAANDDWAMALATRAQVLPSKWPNFLVDVAAAVAQEKAVAAPVAQAVDAAAPSAQAQAIATALLTGEHKAILLGNAAAAHPQASLLLALAQWIAQHTGATCGYLGESGNSVGAQLVNAMPGAGGLNAGQMLSQPMKALVLLNCEPLLDSADAAATRAALAGSGMVVALTPFNDTCADVADVMLPIAPFTETGGSFVNAEGRLQSFHGVVKPQAEARPAWKVLRVLGNLLGLASFDQETVEEVRAQALGEAATADSTVFAARLNNSSSAALRLAPQMKAPSITVCERVSDVPLYSVDATVRRAASLQRTADAAEPVVGIPTPLWGALRLTDKVMVTQGATTVVLAAREDKTVADGAVRIPAGHATTAMLGAMFGSVTLEKV
jgi:NADH-quinone oxidoreductase subunit G